MIEEQTGLHDSNGIPIHVGDLIRVKHFKTQTGSQRWCYFRVTKERGRYKVHDWSDDPDTTAHACQLHHVGLETAEVLMEAQTVYVPFDERPRNKERRTDATETNV